MNEAKPWYLSKTLWFNSGAAALVALEANFHMLQPLLPVNVYVLFSALLPVLNAWLRVVTTKPVTFSG